MKKPDVTLGPSKQVVADMAARIYAAHIVRGDVRDGENADWMERSIREAVRIAKTVAASIETEEASNTAPHQAADLEAGQGVSDSDVIPSPQSEAETSSSSSPNVSKDDANFDAIVEETLSGEDAATGERDQQ